MSGIAGFAEVKEAELVITEQRKVRVFAGEGDDGGAVGAAVDEIAEQNDAVVALRREFPEEILELAVTSVDVADGDESAFHAGRGI